METKTKVIITIVALAAIGGVSYFYWDKIKAMMGGSKTAVIPEKPDSSVVTTPPNKPSFFKGGGKFGMKGIASMAKEISAAKKGSSFDGDMLSAIGNDLEN